MIGSITVLEATVLNSFLALLTPKVLFEFGTFLGYSTALFVQNTNSDSKIYSIDLDKTLEELSHASSFSKEDIMAIDTKNDQYLSLIQAQKGVYYLQDLPLTQRNKVTLLKGNSTTFDYEGNRLTEGYVDFIFIDGGHDYTTIEKDTKNALKMIGENGLIIWHDYNSKIHFDVTRFVDELSNSHKIFHLEHTMLAFLAKGTAYETLFL